MLAAAAQFLTYNLTAGLLAGLLMAVVVLTLATALGVRDARSRNILLGLALAKSTLVLAGLGLILPLPDGLWISIRERGIAPEYIVPALLVWVAVLLLAHRLAQRRVIRRASETSADPEIQERVDTAIERVTAAINARDSFHCSRFCRAAPGKVTVPRVILTADRRSPAIVSDPDPPVLLIPARLVPLLDDEELDAIVAHELGHLLVNSEQSGIAHRWAHLIRLTSPTSLVLGRLLDREQELACDEIAAELTQSLSTVASALLKAYRFQREVTSRVPSPAARLLPFRPLLEHRIRRLTSGAPATGSPSQIRLLPLWIVTGYLLFSF